MVSLILSNSQYAESRRESVVQRLRVDPSAADTLVAALLRRPESQVRFWAAAIGAELIGLGFVEQLKELIRDRSPEVRSLAIQELRRLDIGALKQYAPIFRRRLQTTQDEMEVRQYLFLLAQLDGAEAVGEIRAFANRPGRWIANKHLADVLVAYLEQGPGEILRRIDQHDHAYMSQLTVVVRMLIRNSEGISILERCLATAPDEDCRQYCREDLEALRTSLRVACSGPSDEP
jgi:hypothetical protein